MAALPPWTPLTSHSMAPATVEDAENWTFCPGPRATYCGLMLTEPVLVAMGVGWVGEDGVGGGTVPWVTPQPAARSTARKLSASGAAARDVFKSLLPGWALRATVGIGAVQPESVQGTKSQDGNQPGHCSEVGYGVFGNSVSFSVQPVSTLPVGRIDVRFRASGYRISEDAIARQRKAPASRAGNRRAGTEDTKIRSGRRG